MITMSQRNETGNLPVRNLLGNIFTDFQNAYPGFAEEIQAQIDHHDLGGAVEYDNRKRPFSYPAEITEERKIILFEPYMAYLWCLSYGVVTFFHEREGDIDPSRNPKLAEAIELLQYGYSLSVQWQEWPAHLPDPTKGKANTYVGEANAIMSFASGYILAHEYGHHILGHELGDTGLHEEDSKKEEFAADKYAYDVLISGFEESSVAKNHTISVAIIVGLGSILLMSNTWEGGLMHPDINQRLYRILNHLGPDPNGEYWKWGLLILFMWNVAYRRKNDDPMGHGSPKADYEFLDAYLRSGQPPTPMEDSAYYSQ